MRILDVSHRKLLKDTGKCQYFGQEFSHLYRPCGQDGYEQDSFEIVYSGESSVNQTKFYPILLKEWFYLVEKDGILVIDYEPNQYLGPLELEDELWTQWPGKYDIIEHRRIKSSFVSQPNELEKSVLESLRTYEAPEDVGFDRIDPVSNSGYWRITIRKNISTKIEGDEIGKWSFGIVTNGKRNDWLDSLIKSIEALNIPQYEVLICGNLNPDFILPEKTRYIPFNKRSDLGWLDKKKNLLITNAAFENVVIMHDRYVFEAGWYEGMKKWGNNFEYITCRQSYESEMGIPYFELHSLKDFSCANIKDLRKRRGFRMFEYPDNDFYRNCYMSGGLQIAKKSFFKQVGLWDENAFWQEGEDVLLSKKFSQLGMYARNNIFSKCVSRGYFVPKKTFLGILDYVGIQVKPGFKDEDPSLLLTWRNTAKYIFFYLVEKSMKVTLLDRAYVYAKNVIKFIRH